MYQDAIKDGVRTINKWDDGYFNVFYPKCHICGEEVLSYSYSSKKLILVNLVKRNLGLVNLKRTKIKKKDLLKQYPG